MYFEGQSKGKPRESFAFGARCACALGALFLLGSGAATAAPIAPTIVFMTDFGQKSESVAICKGVMLRINPALRIVDLTHEAPPFDVRTAALMLARTVRYYPTGTVFVAVVDPGVGTTRRALAARTTGGHFLVGPDNGLLSTALAKEGAAEVHSIVNAAWFNKLDPVSPTFHGRDVFSPVAAHLASRRELAQVGPPVADWIKVARKEPSVEAAADGTPVLRGETDFLDVVYGNVATNIPLAWADKAGLRYGDPVEIRLDETRISGRYVRTFGEVEKGEVLVYPDDANVFGLAIREGDFTQRYGARAGDIVEIRKTGSSGSAR